MKSKTETETETELSRIQWVNDGWKQGRESEKDLLVFVADVVKKDQKALKSDSVNVQNEIVCPNKC